MQASRSGKLNISLFHSADDLVEKAAELFGKAAKQSLSERGRFVVALSGGRTPRALYERLAVPPFSSSIDWTSTFMFLGDERCVSHDSPESNFLMAKTALFDRVSLAEANIFATERQDSDPEFAAADYERRIRSFFHLKEGELPRFDLIFLGLGPDGHTASLFPDSKALTENEKLVAANFVEKFQSFRLTFTFPVINNSRHVLFLITGKEKEDIVPLVLQDRENDGKRYPAARVRPHDGRVDWFIDRDAAANLNL